MIPRLSRYALCGCLAASLGCQNPSHESHKLAEKDSFNASLSFASDDPASLETGRGHLPSLASEMADQRRAEAENLAGIPGGSNLTIRRLLERGNDADAHGRTQEARMYYEQALAEDPEQPDAHHRLAILADRAGDFSRAEQHYRLALRGKPNDADVLNDLGYSYFLQGRAADSERYLNQARQIDPRHPHVTENLSLLYDPAKAEKVLLTMMGPRQTQATLAQLFQHIPPMERQQPIASLHEPRVNEPDQRLSQSSNETTASLESLQRKMEEARLRSIAERQKRNSPGQEAGLAERNGGLPPLPLNHPTQVPSRWSLQAAEIPDGRINDAFRSIDNEDGSETMAHSYTQRRNAPSVMPPAYDARRINDARDLASIEAGRITEQRASAPQWNAPPQSWPAYSPQAMPEETIEQTHHTSAPTPYPQANSARPSLPSAARRAAEIGMAAGPGAIFPPMAEGYDSTELQQGPAPAARLLPGTDSRMNGAMYSPPGEQGVPTYWHNNGPAPDQSGAYGQPPAQWNDPPSQSGGNAPPNGYANDPYDQMRAQHNAQFNRDQQALAAQSGLLSNGPPAREELPGSFDPNRQDWPAYTREQYDTRRMDQMPETSQPQGSGYGRYGGQTLPQPAPQNYGRRW